MSDSIIVPTALNSDMKAQLVNTQRQENIYNVEHALAEILPRAIGCTLPIISFPARERLMSK